MTPKEIEIDRLIAYNKRKSVQMINFILCIIAVIIIVAIQLFIPVDPATKTSMPVNDTIYTYYRGEQGYIRLHDDKPSQSDLNHVKTMDSCYNIALKNHYKTSLIEIPILIANDPTYQKVINWQIENHSEIIKPIEK